MSLSHFVLNLIVILWLNLIYKWFTSLVINTLWYFFVIFQADNLVIFPADIQVFFSADFLCVFPMCFQFRIKRVSFFKCSVSVLFKCSVSVFFKCSVSVFQVLNVLWPCALSEHRSSQRVQQGARCPTSRYSSPNSQVFTVFTVSAATYTHTHTNSAISYSWHTVYASKF